LNQECQDQNLTSYDENSQGRGIKENQICERKSPTAQLSY